MTTTLFTNAHIATGEPGSTAASTLPLQDILVTDGVFTAFGPGLAQQYEAQGGRSGRQTCLPTVLRYASAP